VLIYAGCGWTYPATYSSDRDVDGRTFLHASVTEPVVRSFKWQFLIVSGRIVVFLPFTVRHHIRTATTEFHTSLRAAICARSLTVKRPAIFVAIGVLPLSATAHIIDARIIKSYFVTYI
jgi:hypothetical protein